MRTDRIPVGGADELLPSTRPQPLADPMLDWLLPRDPKKKLQRRYETAMQQARDIQRRGDIVGYAAKVEEAEQLRKQLAQLDRPALDSDGRAG